jgi:hypothetical protein
LIATVIGDYLGGGDAPGVQLMIMGGEPMGTGEIMIIEDGQSEFTFGSYEVKA